jgi:peptide/nickel transport system ATP-binding protein
MKNDTIDEGPLLEIKNLRKDFTVRSGFWQRQTGLVSAVNDISFSINKGETLGLVGESGCGKTTTGRAILRAINPSAGEIWFNDKNLGKVDVAALDAQDLRNVRRNMQMIFQDPYSSLDSRMTLLQIIGEPLVVHHLAKGKEVEERVAEMLKAVGLRPEHMNRYPHAFSGGQRQRIGIARSLMTQPKLVVCDEPVSALDVSVQAQILNLLKKLQSDFGLTYLFISHDLSVIEHFSDRVAVMYVGKIVENSETEEMFLRPRHPYTEALLSAVPQPDPRKRTDAIILQGEVASPANPPSGCFFHPRCQYKGAICEVEQPELEEISPGHYVRCHFAKSLNLKGIQ